jgi:hypothetical protein
LPGLREAIIPPRGARRALTWLSIPFRPLVAALLPDRRVGPEVIAGRYGWPLLDVVLCACLAALALGVRLDFGPEVLADNSGRAPAKAIAQDQPPTEIKTDREIDEQITQRTAVTRVMLGLGAVVFTPLRVGLLGLGLFLLGWFIGGRPSMRRAVTAAALAAVPAGVRSLVTAVAAWRQHAIGSNELDSLVTSALPIQVGHPALARLLDGVDLFTWWSVVILGFGLCAVADVKRAKSFIAVAIGFLLYLAVTRLIAGGGGPPPGVAAS